MKILRITSDTKNFLLILCRVRNDQRVNIRKARACKAVSSAVVFCKSHADGLRAETMPQIDFAHQSLKLCDDLSSSPAAMRFAASCAKPG